MKQSDYEFFISPGDGQPLVLVDSEIDSRGVKTGRLQDTFGKCIAVINNHIPDFVMADGYASNFGFQWNLHRSIQLDSFNGSLHSRSRLLETAGWPDNISLKGKRVLEVGSGAGRFTEILADLGAEVWTFDYSAAVEANYHNNGWRENVRVFRGNIYEMPFNAGGFDIVVCMGVLQHTPNVRGSFLALTEMVSPGGQLVVDVYAKTFRQIAHWKYLLRPITTRIHVEHLYRVCASTVKVLLPISRVLNKIGGRALSRVLPIMDLTGKEVSDAHGIEWSILDTFDAYSATYDQPQRKSTIIQWFQDAGFTQVKVCGAGVIRGTGIKVSQ